MKVGDLVTWKYSDDVYDIGVVVKTWPGSTWLQVQWSWATKMKLRHPTKQLRKVTDEGR